MGYPVYDVAVGQIVYRRLHPKVVGVVLKVTPPKNKVYGFKEVTVHWFQKYKEYPAGSVTVEYTHALGNFERLAEDTMKKAKNHMKRLKDAKKAAEEVSV